MKKVFLLMMILVAMGCSNRQDGIYQVKDGWDIVDEGKTYKYRCEPDGLYLYIDWDGNNSYSMNFRHNSGEKLFVHFKFLCKNKDGNYAYVTNYQNINVYFYDLNEIGFDLDKGREIIYQYKPNKACFSLLEKYTSR